MFSRFKRKHFTTGDEGPHKRTLAFPKKLFLLACLVTLGLCTSVTSVSATEMFQYQSGAVPVWPNKNSYNLFTLPVDTAHTDTIWVDIPSVNDNSETPASAGHHYYQYDMPAGTILRVHKWKNCNPGHACIHSSYPGTATSWLGVSFNRSVCGGWLSPGWIAYCSECNGEIPLLHYTSEARIRNVDHLIVGDAFLSKCIHCDNLEQGSHINHKCRTESINKYIIEYNGNGHTSGYVARSFHYVSNNSQVYYERYLSDANNVLVANQTTLNNNTFSRTGYTFKGWSTSPSGSVMYNNCGSTSGINATYPEDGEIVTLYAVWEANTHKVTINANGGKYNNQTSVVNTGAMNTTLTLDVSKLTAPNGYTVTFNGNGGSVVGGTSLTPKKIFNGWQQAGAFQGTLLGNVYYYPAPTSNDVVNATWRHGEITLPNATRSGFLFTGWYSDAACTTPIGNYGDVLTVSSARTLYAGWANLSLTSKEDYVANSKKGAVDLTWSQGGSDSRSYKVYQSTNNSSWTQLNSSSSNVETPAAVSWTPSGTGTFNYTIPANGIYKFTLYGAQGGDSGGKVGGKGGKTTCSVYLSAGTVLKVEVGNKGGAANATLFGAGGQWSAIYRVDNGQCIALAGGGGGASPSYDGGPGGNSSSTTLLPSGNPTGQAGAAGGGNGMQGGIAGSVIYHTHNQAICGYHEHEGNPTDGGACYGGLATCGGTIVCHSESDSWGPCSWWSEWCSNHKTEHCIRCCGTSSDGHTDTTHNSSCNRCGKSYSSHSGTCSETSRALSCTDTVGWHCGKEEGVTVDSATMSYGGTNYVNTSCVYDYNTYSDQKTGNGSVKIESVFLGMADAMYLNDVPAPDTAKPNAITNVTYGLNANIYTFQWYNPGDNGTKYYHKVTSLTTSGTNVGQELTSSPTVDTLTTGVDKYYWQVTTVSTYNPTASDGVVNNSSGAISVTYNRSSLAAGTYYFCVAPVDVAGNIGPTYRVTLSIPKPITDNTITFNGNGEKINGQTTITKTVKANKTDNNNVSSIFTKNSVTGKTFLGWNTKVDGSGTMIYNSSGKYTGDGVYWSTEGKWIGTQDLTLYAQWTWNEYDLIYTVRPDKPPTGGSTYEEGYDWKVHLKYTEDTTILNRDNSTITRDGYLLTGWNSDNASNTIKYNMDSKVNKLSASNGSTFRLYACWTPITYTVTYSKSGLEGEKFGKVTTATVTCKYDSSFNTWGTGTMTRKGYTLIGWDEVPNKTENPKYALNQPIKNLTTIDGYEITLYPVWEQNAYTVRYHNDQDGTYVDQENCIWTGTYNSYINGVDTHFHKEGYYVAYWTNRDGTLVLTADPLHESEPDNISSTFQSLASGDEAIVDVYPVWEQNKFYIQYLAYKGSACDGTAPLGADTYNYLKPSFNDGTTKTIAFGGESFTAIAGNASTGSEKSVNNAVKYSYEDTVVIPHNCYTNANKDGTASEFKGWSLNPDAISGTITEGSTYTRLTPQRNQVITLYASFDQYPVIGVKPPTGIPYSSNDPGVITLSTLVSYDSLDTLSGSLAERWLLDNCISYAYDKESATKVYISYFNREVLSSIDRPTLLTITFTVEDAIGQCTHITTYWEIYANGTTNILIN